MTAGLSHSYRAGRTALAVLVVAALVAAASPALAVTATLVSDDDFLSAPPLGATPQTGDLGVTVGDVVDRFAVTLSEGQVFSAALSGPAGQDFDLSLYSPQVTTAPSDAEDFFLVSRSRTDGTANESLSLLVPPGGAGTYFLEVRAFATAAGGYSIAWSAAAQEAPRIFGADRYETSYAASRSSFTTASAAVVASGANFPDALSAAGLAGAVEGPVLLAPYLTSGADSRLEALVREVVRLGCTKLYVVGGTAAVSDYVHDQLAMTGSVAQIERIGGDTRYQTARRVAEEIDAIRGTPATEAFVVRGDAFPDALAVSPFAYAGSLPILLTTPTALDGSTSGYLETANVTSVFLAGGTSAANASVESALGALNGGTTHVERMFGDDRYATAAAVASIRTSADPGAWDTIGIATGTNFPDALSGGSACGIRGGVLLLTKGTELSSAAGDLIDSKATTGSMALVLGGEAALSEGVRSAVAALIP